MALAKRRKNESQKDFIDRCMADDIMNDEYPQVKQRRAVCQKQWDNKNKNVAPGQACIFTLDSEVGFAETEKTEQKGSRFRIVGYSGGILTDHWYWGNVAFDLAGLRFAKEKTPVLAEHLRETRIGFTTDQRIKDKVIVEGKFLSNPAAQQMRTDIEDGFPMQASLYVPPSVVEQVATGASVEVNGRTLKGPGAVFRKALIHEVSMCTLGADSHTEAKAFAGGGRQEIEFNVLEKENIMAKEQKAELTVDAFAAEHPGLFEEIKRRAKADGEKAERDRFSAFAERFGDDPAFCLKVYNEGKELELATAEYTAKLKTERDQAVAEAEKAAKKNVDPAHQEFSDEQDGADAHKKAEAAKSDEQKWTEDFNASDNLKAQFGGNLKAYMAYKKGKQTGQIRERE